MADSPAALTSAQARKLGQWARKSHHQSLPWLRGYLCALASLPLADATGSLLNPLRADELDSLLHQQFALIAHDLQGETPKLPAGCGLQSDFRDNFSRGVALADWSRGFDDGMGQAFSSWEVLLPELDETLTEELDACWSMLSFFADLPEAAEMIGTTSMTLEQSCVSVRRDLPMVLKAYAAVTNELRQWLQSKPELAARALQALPGELPPFDLPAGMDAQLADDEADRLEQLWESAMQAENLSERQQLLESALNTAEDALGRQTFVQHKGAFWLVHETRPYMQALALLMECLQMQGKLDEAMAKAEYALELCPSDNLGLRYPLIGMLLETRQYSRVHAMMEQFDESSVFFHYARALLMFIEQRGSLKASTARKRAVKANPHFARLLGQNAGLPEERAPYYSPGDENEAIMLLEFMGNAWYGQDGAVRWLGSKS
ncbi:MAG: hypothetical protein OIF57_04145 [Marinobacterium sp.]|nr:hypothetical protein [Marinobacterium sp.]